MKTEFCFVSPSPQQQATMESTTLLRLKTEQEKMGRDERRQKDAARAIIELAKQKREEAQKPRGSTIQDNARLVETCLEKTREQLRLCTGEKEVLEILSREKQRALDVAHEEIELYQRTVNASMLKNAKDVEIREIADRELNAGKAKLDERCELDAAQCKLARMQQENQALKDDLGKAHEASQALICLSKNATDELRFCREDKLNMMSKVQELQRQLEAVQKELELEKVCHEKLLDDCRERQAAVEGVSKKIMEENRRCIEREAELQKKLQKRESELERTKTEWQNSNKGLEDMKRIEILGTHIKQLAETSREFREELRVCTGEKEAMEQEINNLSRELEKAVSAKDNAEAKAQEAKHLVEKTQEQLRLCTGEKKEMESLSREKQRALDVAQEEMELYQRQVNEREGALQKELQKCEAQLECTKTELQNLYKGLEDMKKIEILFNASAVQLANASAAAEAFRNENCRCNEHIRTLQMSLEALNQRCNEEIDVMKAANCEMQTSLDIAQIELETERDRGLSRERELLWECQKGGERLEQILEAMLLEPANKTLSTMEIQFQRLREYTERMKRKASADAILALVMSERDSALTYALSQKGEEILQKERIISEFQTKYKFSVENLERNKVLLVCCNPAMICCHDCPHPSVTHDPFEFIFPHPTCT